MELQTQDVQMKRLNPEKAAELDLKMTKDKIFQLGRKVSEAIRILQGIEGTVGQTPEQISSISSELQLLMNSMGTELNEGTSLRRKLFLAGCMYKPGKYLNIMSSEVSS